MIEKISLGRKEMKMFEFFAFVLFSLAVTAAIVSFNMYTRVDQQNAEYFEKISNLSLENQTLESKYNTLRSKYDALKKKSETPKVVKPKAKAKDELPPKV